MTPRKPPSKVVCECLGVTESQIVAAVRAHGLCTVKQVGACTEAGSGCTACHPAIREYLAREARTQARRDAEPPPAYSASLPIFSAR